MLERRKHAELIRKIRQVIIEPGNLHNSVFSLGQTIVSVVCLFFSYKILISTQGLDALGLWSLLLAFGGVVRFLDVSGASALARFVPRADYQEDGLGKAELIHTLLIASCIFNLLVIALFLGISIFFIFPSLDSFQRVDAQILLPWVLLTLLLMPLSTGVSAAVDGLQCTDVRALISSFASIFSLGVNAALIPQLGVSGFAIGQIVQITIIICLGWAALRHRILDFGWIPTKWHFQVFKRTFSYSMKMNGIGLISFFFEPLCKILIGLSGGTTALAIYELSSRLVVQIRSLVLAGTMPLLPLFASMPDVAEPRFAEILMKASRVTVWLSPAVAIISILGAPIMSFVVLGYVSRSVVQMTAILAWGWSINVLALPLYLAAQAMGVIRWNFLSHLVLSFCVPFFWLILNTQADEIAVALGVAFGLVIGTICVIFGNTAGLSQDGGLKKLGWVYSLSGILGSIICFFVFVVSFFLNK